jgi:hypothetical protein
MPTLRSLAPCAIALALLSAGPGCRKSDDASRPSGVAPGAPGAPAPPAAAPVPAPPAAPAAPGGGAGPAKTISGKITLAAARKANVAAADVVYLSARRISDNPQARGALVAVKRFSASSFPIEFSLGPADMMFGDGTFEGELSLTVRVDKDGDPITRKKGDVYGGVDRVKVGTAGVELKLSELQEKDESLAGPGAGTTGMPSRHP